MDEWYREDYREEAEIEVKREAQWRYLRAMCESEGHLICNFENGWATCECGHNQRQMNGIETAKEYIKKQKEECK